MAQPDWWALAKAHKHKLSLLAAEENGGDSDGGAYFASPALDAAPLGVWSTPFVEGPKRPPPRYEHAAATVGPNLYVLGGNCGARPCKHSCKIGNALLHYSIHEDAWMGECLGVKRILTKFLTRDTGNFHVMGAMKC